MKTNRYPISEYEDLEMPSDDMDTDIENNVITHWMPLPEPPEEEN